MGDKKIREMTDIMRSALVALLDGEARLIVSPSQMDYYQAQTGLPITQRTMRSLERRGFVVSRASNRYMKITLLGRVEARAIVKEEQASMQDALVGTP